MAKGDKKTTSKRKKSRKKRLAAVVWILLAAVLIFLIVCINRANREEQRETASDQSTENSNAVSTKSEMGGEEQESEGLTFPFVLTDGKLRVNSLFQYSGLNPDCNNEEGEDIAALEIENQSEEFCRSAEIKVTMINGAELLFRAEDIPAGKKVWIFESGNQSIGQEDKCGEILGKSEFGQASLMEDRLSVSTEDTVITIENLSGEEITDLTVSCHCLFEDTYFGGLAYRYSTGVLPAGGKVSVDAADCYMGTAEAVCISEKNKE